MDERRQRVEGRRYLLRRFVVMVMRIISRTEITGLDKIPAKGPLLILFNHVSTLDGPLVVGIMPYDIDLVGPGDFPPTPFEDFVLRSYGLIRVNRGRPDRTSLRQMTDILKNDGMLAMAPGGGTWEKRPTDAKPGAAFLSQLTDAPILPIALGGLYNAPTSNWRYLIKRPKFTVTVGDVLPPVPKVRDRAEREALLDSSTINIMETLIAMMPEEDRALYEHWKRATYDLQFSFMSFDEDDDVPYTGPTMPDMTALGEFLAKRNLVRPIYVNARLHVEPFTEQRYFAGMLVKLAARDLHELLAVGAYDVYLQYRLGDHKAESALAALKFIQQDLTEWALHHELRIKMTPIVKDSLKSH